MFHDNHPMWIERAKTRLSSAALEGPNSASSSACSSLDGRLCEGEAGAAAGGSSNGMNIGRRAPE
jgi:hypothetical protein